METALLTIPYMFDLSDSMSLRRSSPSSLKFDRASWISVSVELSLLSVAVAASILLCNCCLSSSSLSFKTLRI
jgi:hypothetical protein